MGAKTKRKPPTRYNATLHPEIAEGICREFGADNEKLSKAMGGISRNTIAKWGRKHPEFRHAILRGKQDFDGEQVIPALLKRALGYEYTEETFEPFQPTGSDEGAELGKAGEGAELVLTKRVTKEQPPDVAAIIFWLCNRHPDEWRQRNETKHTGNAPFQMIVNAPGAQPQESPDDS